MILVVGADTIFLDSQAFIGWITPRRACIGIGIEDHGKRIINGTNPAISMLSGKIPESGGSTWIRLQHKCKAVRPASIKVSTQIHNPDEIKALRQVNRTGIPHASVLVAGVLGQDNIPGLAKDGASHRAAGCRRKYPWNIENCRVDATLAKPQEAGQAQYAAKRISAFHHSRSQTTVESASTNGNGTWIKRSTWANPNPEIKLGKGILGPEN